MLRKRQSKSVIWKFFTSTDRIQKRAKCELCSQSYSYATSATNLTQHLKAKHQAAYIEYCQNKKSNVAKSSEDNDDEDSNSSYKFSSAVWGFFEQEDELSRCSICEKTTDNTVEDMRGHLEEDHPSVLLGILNNKYDVEETDTPDETFTEVVYLEDEEKRTPKQKRHKPSQKQNQDEQTFEYKVIPTVIQPPRPDIDTFLNYIGFLLRNVPIDAMPKLQLDVISFIIKAQMNSVSKNCNCDGKGTISAVNSNNECDMVVENKDTNG